MLGPDPDAHAGRRPSQDGAQADKARLEVATPGREALLLTPSALVQVGGSPHSRRYLSVRKIDFASSSSTKAHGSAKKLSFLK